MKCWILMIITLTSAAITGGCATKDSVLFVTKTSLGVDFDTKPAALNVAYERYEGYVGPRYDNGAVPPVVAKIKTDGGIFSAKVQQMYATGNAAIGLTSNQQPVSNLELQGGKEAMFFGTSTTTGLKIGFTGYAPDSFNFGFKRKEFTYIPVGTAADGTDHYPSVIGTVDTAARAKSNADSGLNGVQFFATGVAADYLAHQPYMQKMFTEEIKDAFATYYETVTLQESEIAHVLKCYVALKEKDLPDVWVDADAKALFYDQKNLEQMTGWYEAIKNDQSLREENIRRANKRYLLDISRPDGKDEKRAERLGKHAKTICELARQ